MDTAELDYSLPAAAIAQVPIEPRDAARLLVDRGPGVDPGDFHVRDLPGLVGPGDVVVVNETRVRPARLRLHKATGGAVELLLLNHLGGREWEALARPAGRLKAGITLVTEPPGLTATVVASIGDGHVCVAVEGDVDAHGEMPLPPYIKEPPADPERYQTVFARRPASAAAPTAGLHLTPEVLARCAEAGASIHTVDLAIGVDTFRPITADVLADHPMHCEEYAVPADTLDACRQARRVVAVGTTVVRSLESAAATGRLAGRTDLFICRGYRFALVDVLLTNFHVPRTTLLALVDAFVGPRWRDLYAEALRRGYRFLSFGDAMLLSRQP